MELIACRCNWGIPGVEELPAHHHPWSPNESEHPEWRVHPDGRKYVVMVRDQDPWQEPHIWVNWKDVART